jgi:hypothetical protein
LLLLVAALAGCSGGGGGNDGPGAGVAPPDQKGSNGWLFGQLKDADGPLVGGTVTAAGQPSVRTGENGTFLVPNLSVGVHNVTYSADFHDPYTAMQEVASGAGTQVTVGLAVTFLAPGVPAQYGLLVTYVDEDDRLIAAAGPPGSMTIATDKTDDRSYFGYWKINADEGYDAVHWFVNVTWTPSETVKELGLRYFRGESIQENEITEGTSAAYHIGVPVSKGATWKTFELANEDIPAFGKRTWQIGVYPSTGDAEQPYGANTNYHIVITAALLSDGAPLQPA